MQKKLYKIELQRILAVWAESPEEAKSLGLEREMEDVEAWPPDFYFCDEVESIGEIPSNWHSKTPITNDEFLTATVEEILDPNYVDPTYDGG